MNKRDSDVLSSSFISELLSRILNWQCNENNAGFIVEEYNSNKKDVEQSVADWKTVFVSLCCNNLSKLVFAHLSIDSIRNKFRQTEHVGDNIDILMVF